MSHSAVDPQPKRTRLIAILVAVVVALGVLIFVLTQPGKPQAGPPTTPAPSQLVSPNETLAPPPAPATPKPITSASDPALAGCTAVTEGFVPNRYTIERFGVDEPIVALDRDKDDNIAAPPLDEPRMASWWSGGPKPGADKGKVVLSIHTYRTGNALGNELYQGGASQFQPGDVLKLYGDAGQVMCYQYTDAEKIFIDDYDPDSTVMLDADGAPALTIIICWDFIKSTKVWDSRVFFHFAPVTVV